jgi:putative protease
LCRNEAQLEAVIEAGLREVELDFMERVGLARAVERARRAGLRVTVATVRVQKPGEETYDTHTARLEPDGVLVRHWGALMTFASLSERTARPALHGDFSLNVTNAITAHHLLSLGLDTLTLAHDLDRVQALALLSAAPAERFTVALHHHIAAFHTEHCVYAHTLSRGRDFRTCGRPCEAHAISLRDRLGLEHPVIVDVGCRNTVFNAQAQSAASLVANFLTAGVRRFRVELVRESRDEATRVLSAYADLLSDRCGPAEAVRRAGVHEQFGVTRGTMMVLR